LALPPFKFCVISAGMNRNRQNKAEEYIARLFGRESPHHLAIREALSRDGKEGINVGAAEGAILRFLLGLVKAKTVVEIGTLYGYSTLYIAESLPASGKVISLEKNPQHYAEAKRLLDRTPQAAKITLMQGDALENLRGLGELEADAIFIDADKPNYPNYLEWAMKHVRVGGLIIGDNTFLFGHVIGEDRGRETSPTALAAMKSFNETLANTHNFRSVILPTQEGMTLAERLY
jgi:predicted O-methyltransferase YrrM